MFESAEIGHTVGKSVWRQREPVLRQTLLDAQYALLASGRGPVIVLVNGVDGAGKGETVNLLHAWMDPRHIRTQAFGPATPEESRWPEMARFWRALPPKGHIGMLFGSWYTEPILARVMGHQRKTALAERLEQIRQFERMLVAEGAVLVKLWFHLSRQAAVQRHKALRADPLTRWRAPKEEGRHLRQYDDFVAVCERVLRKTSTGEAPWQIIDGTDPAYRALTAGEAVLQALRAAVAGPASVAAAVPLPAPALDGRGLLDSMDHGRTLDRKTYAQQLPALQARLAALCRDPRMAARSLVVVFEGMDAAGKGSTIRRITEALDARHYRVVPVAAPSEEERAQPYLWRFWRQVPPRGGIVIFDRSWYGRVLVERVEGFCPEAAWLRAYAEINAFEEELARHGALVVKFWLDITAAEQLRRFRERQETPHKNFKITDEDWRNRDKWPAYQRAVADMVDRTSTGVAPWHVVATDDKRLARVEVLETLCQAIERALDSRRR